MTEFPYSHEFHNRYAHTTVKLISHQILIDILMITIV